MQLIGAAGAGPGALFGASGPLRLAVAFDSVFTNLLAKGQLMNLQICLEKLKLIGTLDFANVAEDGSPQVRCISALHYEPDAVYFLTSRGKPFARDLARDGRVQAVGRTRFNEMLRLSGRAVEVPGVEGVRIRDLIYAEQPYLANVYPGQTRDINVIFQIEDASIEYFNLGVHPIFRETYRLDGGQAASAAERARACARRASSRLARLVSRSAFTRRTACIAARASRRAQSRRSSAWANRGAKE